MTMMDYNQKQAFIKKCNDQKVNMFKAPNVLYDSWACLMGVTRLSFPVEDLIQRYPSLLHKIRELRKLMHITLVTRQRVQPAKSRHAIDVTPKGQLFEF